MDSPTTNALAECSTDALLAELKRRAVGVLIAVMLIDESGDRWMTEAKGSPTLLEALAGMVEQKYFPEEDDSEREETTKT